MGLIISVSNMKGGVGKTTLAFNLADAYLRRGRSVALVDADPQGSLTELLALDDAASAPTVAFLDPTATPVWADAPGRSLKATTAGLDLNGHLSDKARVAHREALAAGGEVVIIDAGPNALNHLPFLEVSDLWIVPALADGLSLQHAAQMGELAREMGKPFLVVLNMVNVRASQTMGAAIMLIETYRLRERLARTLIPRSEKINQASFFKEPVHAYAGAMGRPFEQLADEIDRMESKR
ncbi:MAG: ParA family protein [Nitrospinae bacterium]|nr:ParA family protein [Nitrospinota bacterium]